MRLKEILGLVWINILENKFKVLLTSLGIIVGAATIILVIAIGKGGQQEVADQFKNLNAGAVEIRYQANQQGLDLGGGMPSFGGDFGGGGAPSFGGGAPAGGSSARASGGGMPSFGGGNFGGGSAFGGARSNVSSTLSYEDVEEIALFVPDITTVTISASGSYAVLAGEMEEESDYTVAGVYPAYAQVSNLSVSVGEFITEEENDGAEKVCVLGSRIAEDIFGSALSAYNSAVTIDGRDYTVVGVLQSMGTVSSGISPDSAIYVPYATGEKYLFGRDIDPVVTVLADQVSHVSAVMEDVELVLSDLHPGVTYTITDAGSSMEAATRSANTLAMLLIGVATIVFIVGGIGIMNVLFVSVKERTREIGILKALGCSRKDILMEFLMESNMISLFGGIVGVCVGLGLIPLLSIFEMNLISTPGGAALALVFAVVTGTLFGFYPAAKAAALRPIEALNHE